MDEDQSKPSKLILTIWTGLIILAITFPPFRDTKYATWDGFGFIGDDTLYTEIAIPILVLELAVITLVCGVWWKLGDK